MPAWDTGGAGSIGVARAPCARAARPGQGPRGRAGTAEPRRAAGPAGTPGCCCCPDSGSSLSGFADRALLGRGVGGVPCALCPHGRGRHPPPACASSELQRVVCLFNTRIHLFLTTLELAFKRVFPFNAFYQDEFSHPWCFQTFRHNLSIPVTARRWQPLVRRSPSPSPCIYGTRYLRFPRLCANGGKKSAR